MWDRKYVTCNVCHGKGILPTPDRSKWQVCPRCGGKGKIPVSVEEYIWKAEPLYQR